MGLLEYVRLRLYGKTAINQWQNQPQPDQPFRKDADDAFPIQWQTKSGSAVKGCALLKTFYSTLEFRRLMSALKDRLYLKSRDADRSLFTRRDLSV